MLRRRYRERSAERVNSRNGYRARTWGTGVGSIELAIPRLLTGCYFPSGCWSSAGAARRR